MNQRYRERAIAAMQGALPKLTDAEIDRIARIALSLPERPKGAAPFRGWLLPQRKEEITVISSGMTTGTAGVELIKRWEGFRHRPYICPGGVWTIGYGHTKEARAYTWISKAQGETILRKDLKIYEAHVVDLVKVELNQNQFDALVSFCYNLGGGQLRSSTLLKKLNQGKYDEVANWFGRYVYARRKKLPGLVARREDERRLFLSIST